MPNNNILIVEDEKIVAEDIRASVEKMGYSVCAMATTGAEAIEKAELMRPDLILMDIVLKGRMDGIEAATQIKELYKIPVVYLTAFGENSMVQQAKVAEPYGYITKPFRDRDLQIAIEISLYKKQAEERIRKIELWLAAVLRSVGDAVIASDKDRQITFMNEVAEKLTGWNKEDALGKKLTEVLNIKDQDLHDLEKHLVEKVITEGLVINLIEDRLLIAKDGRELPISDSAAPIKEDNGEIPGSVIVFRDVTERMRAEENLRTHQVELEMQNEELRRIQDELEVSRASYFDLYDLAPVSYFTISEKGLILEANLMAATLLGITRRELIRQPLSRFILPEDQAIYYRHRKQLFETGEPQKCELRMVKKDGTEFWALMHATAAQDADGEPICRVVLSDITERMRNEEALFKERNLITNIMESSPVGISTVDSTGNITFANSRAVEILGLSKDEISQTTHNAPKWGISDLDGKPVPDDKLPFNIVMSTGKSVFDVQHAIQWPDGKRILLSINGVPMIDANGHVTGMVASIEDITQRKRDDTERKQLMAAVEQVGEVIIITDAHGSIQFVNPAFELTTGYIREEAIGQNPRILKSGKQDDIFYRNLWETISGGRTWTGRFVNKHKDGTYYTEEATISPVRNVSGQIVNYVAVKRDITEHLLLTNQLFQSQKMEAIGTLAGGIAHDFNNILGAMLGYTELAMEEGDEKRRHNDLNEVLNACKRATELVKQILSFSRKTDVDMKPINADYIVKEVIGLLRSSIPSTIDIKYNISSAPMIIQANSTQIHQVIMNLCTNATHAMKKTGGKLKIELAGIELAKGEIIHHPDLKPGHYVKLTVSDTGHGIDPVNIQRIFDPFFTTKPKDEGTGLGLSVVYGIVKSHGGVITVYSEPDKGATFNVYLPRIIYAETIKEDSDKQITGGTERILFVDDEQALVYLGKHMLSSLGYEVTGLTSSVEALDIFSKSPQSFDLVITDMTIPKMTGIDLSREILQIRPEIPIILCSGILEPGTEEQVKALGIRAYLTKPLTKKKLSRVVRETLDGKEKTEG